MGKKKDAEAEAAVDAHAPAEAAPAPAEAAPEAAPAPRGSHRLWAFLLVLDSVFVVVFAGAVAAKIYQHWHAPSAPAHQARRPGKEKEPKPAEAPAPAASTAAATPVPAPEPAAPKPEPPKEAPKEAPKAAAKPEPKAEPAHGSPRPPKPSLLTDAPKPRTTPGLAGANGATAKAAPAPAPAAAASAATDRPKAKPIAFRLKAPSAKSVALVGAFIVRGGRKEMSKDGDGVWSAEIYLHPGQYRYFFSVDKKKVLDPENPREERGASLLNVP